MGKLQQSNNALQEKLLQQKQGASKNRDKNNNKMQTKSVLQKIQKK